MPCRRPIAGAGGPVEGDLRPRPGPPRLPEPPHRRPRPLRGVPRLRRGDRPLRAAVRDPAGTDRARPAPGLRLDAVRGASATTRSRGSPSSTTTRTWPVAWPSNGLDEPVIGVAFDGTGFGTDGAVWGGEFLTGDYRGFRRAAHLRYVAMPGGEQAIREPWRMAAALPGRRGAGRRAAPGPRARGGAGDRPPDDRAAVQRAADLQRGPALRRRRGPGRRPRPRELRGPGGHGARMAGLGGRPPTASIPSRSRRIGRANPPSVIDTRPLIAEVAAEVRRGRDAAVIGRRFHSTLVEIVAQVCSRLRERTGLAVVVLSGGVFLNALLTGEVVDRLERDGFRVYRHRRVPPGDGGLEPGPARHRGGARPPPWDGIEMRRCRCASESPARWSRPTASTTC